jgi:hypothetical protein
MTFKKKVETLHALLDEVSEESLKYCTTNRSVVAHDRRRTEPSRFSPHSYLWEDRIADSIDGLIHPDRSNIELFDSRRISAYATSLSASLYHLITDLRIGMRV